MGEMEDIAKEMFKALHSLHEFVNDTDHRKTPVLKLSYEELEGFSAPQAEFTKLFDYVKKEARRIEAIKEEWWKQIAEKHGLKNKRISLDQESGMLYKHMDGGD